MSTSRFHLGFCMAGAVSAGAYTAGVMDYLIEALRSWEKAKTDPGNESIPKHDVVIDLLCGTSGGGIASAMALFALQDTKLEHCRLQPNGTTYNKVTNNIFWNSWVEMTGVDIFNQMLDTSDIKNAYVPSGLNATFIDKISKSFKDYVVQLSGQIITPPKYLCPESELFLTMFNVTGIRYTLFTKAASASGQQYVSEHRDIAHFGWHQVYKGKGRMELTFAKANMDKHLNVLINVAKATGAFPVGLKARKVAREAKYIWQNPFFNYEGKFPKEKIGLGDCVKNENDLYLSINADGGTANNEPIELAKDIMLSIRNGYYHDQGGPYFPTTADMTNNSIVLIDPFPSLDSTIVRPKYHADHLPGYLGSLVGAMRSQLLFDAKKALDAYEKDNYGLHLIAPSKDGFPAKHAIACGALGGFGGFLNREFRVHDYFLGRHNCQSFLRKYLVVNLNEPTTSPDYKCVQAIIDSYKGNTKIIERFKYEKDGITWVPIIPDVVLRKHSDIEARYEECPTYKLQILPTDFLEQFRSKLKKRYSAIVNNVFDGSWFINMLLSLSAGMSKGKVVDWVIDYIGDDLIERKLMKGTAKTPMNPIVNCNDTSPFSDM
jgi:hypothetical protein